MAAASAGGTGAQAKRVFNRMNDKLAAGAARLNGGEYQEVDIAIVKATNHDEVPPKEKHVRTLKEAVASAPSRRKIIYIVHDLYERIRSSGEDWLVVLKALMVYHRLMKADNQCVFKMEMGKYKDKRKLNTLLRLDNFSDNSRKETWDYSAWIRAYSIYLDTRLDVFKTASFDLERDVGGGETKLKSQASHELLDLLPRLQQLMQRILGCVPEGAAASNTVIMEALKWVLSECFRLYRATSEGVINLADNFFDMDRVDARKALDIYREDINSTERLQEFFAKIQSTSAGKSLQFPQLTNPPEDFLEQMEVYVKEKTGHAGGGAGKKGTVVTKIGTIISRSIGTQEASGAGAAAAATDNGIKSELRVEEGPNLLSFNTMSLEDNASGSVVSSMPVADPFGESAFGNQPSPISGTPAGLPQQNATRALAPSLTPTTSTESGAPLVAPGGGPLNLLDDWGVPTVSSSGGQSPGDARNDSFSGFESPPSMPSVQPALGGFQQSQAFSVGGSQLGPPPSNPGPVTSQGQMTPGNPFVAGGGIPPAGHNSGFSMATAPGPRQPQQRPIQQAYNRRISDPFGDMISELIPTKAAPVGPGVPMRLDNSPVSGPGAGWAAAVPPIQTTVHRPAGNPFGGPALGGEGAVGGNPFGENAFPSAGV